MLGDVHDSAESSGALSGTSPSHRVTVRVHNSYYNVNDFLNFFTMMFKGSMSRDFRPPVLFMIRTHLGP